jgi:hypothetical protein
MYAVFLYDAPIALAQTKAVAREAARVLRGRDPRAHVRPAAPGWLDQDGHPLELLRHCDDAQLVDAVLVRDRGADVLAAASMLVTLRGLVWNHVRRGPDGILCAMALDPARARRLLAQARLDGVVVGEQPLHI